MPENTGRTEAAERILAAAKHLFARDGYSSVSIRDIAEAAGVSKANVFHHFASKEELYVETLRRCCEAARALIQAFAEDQAREPAEQLRAFVRADLRRALDDPDATRLVLAEAFDASPSQARTLVNQVFGADFRRMTEIFSRGQEDGSWRQDTSPALMASLMLAANTFYTAHREVLRQLPGVDFADDPDQYADHVVDILLDGIQKEA
ncbi:TetR/AcrR family transcriptional regulator [Halorhodospira halophila]|nr:TetR/AcrR family transcriptional regulator [Halorhodospira halophila]